MNANRNAESRDLAHRFQRRIRTLLLDRINAIHGKFWIRGRDLATCT